MTALEVAAVGAAADAVTSHVGPLVADRFASRLFGQDAALWGPAAESEASIRLGWVDTMQRSRALLPQLAELNEELGDLDHVVLAGMGGSSLAPESTR